MLTRELRESVLRKLSIHSHISLLQGSFIDPAWDAGLIKQAKMSKIKITETILAEFNCTDASKSIALKQQLQTCLEQGEIVEERQAY